MSLFSLVATAVFAAESILSPLADEATTVHPLQASHKPAVSFAQLIVTSQTPAPPAATGTLTPTPSPTQTPEAKQTKKQSYTIAVLGDSMVDTLGPGIPHLANALKAAFPTTHFTIHNYGVGASTIEQGLARITGNYTYQNQEMRALANLQPDIVVIESFGYNPFPQAEGGLDRHWLGLAAMVDKLKAVNPQGAIVMAATIAPNSATFGDGAPGLTFSPLDKQQRTDVIKRHLDSTVQFAKSQHLPLADAYHPSLDAFGEGKQPYINQGDHIHPSDAGKALFAQKVVEAIIRNKLL